ncbi:chemokine-like factor [Ornithorhynchus anatinus]|uniref:Chemokine like factor n=1 Tax=Ornithorhynchus anatinus TaxID=9258 RepID=A0A6I8PDS6_ORNAN|nr:chemokine-like factor [Ornithorhynchus anatinus]
MNPVSNPPSPHPGASETGRWNWRKIFGGNPQEGGGEEGQRPAGRLEQELAKIRDNGKEFFTSVRGLLKCASLVLILIALVFFITSRAHESFIAVVALELIIVLFLIIAYVLGLDKQITSLYWPLLDAINSVVTALFLLIVSVLAMLKLETIPAGVFCLLATLVCTADGVIMIRNLSLNPSRPPEK